METSKRKPGKNHLRNVKNKLGIRGKTSAQIPEETEMPSLKVTKRVQVIEAL